MEASQVQAERLRISSTKRRDGRETHTGPWPGATVPSILAQTASGVQASARACRILNLAVASALLVITSPLTLLIALVIKLTSRGPVLYVQPRVGLDRRNGGRPVGNCRRRADGGGRPFRMYKFRTMHTENGNGDGEVWAQPDDPRVTAFGRLLRKYRLDELPQLVNVLRGDMNVVGPRPEQPRIFASLRTLIDGYAERQRVPPGITGWAQVNQHYDLSIEDVRRKLALDLEYIQRRSVREDLRILLRTVPVVIFKQGAW
jgi:lipopolysaccharide/colanic/teichoic acid biosynthesis glycosyltransferase